MRASLARAIRETAESPGLPVVLLTGLLLNLLSGVLDRMPLRLIGFASTALVSGYALSYVRTVATAESPCLPALSDWRSHLRRGLSLYLQVFPLALLATLPLMLLGSLVGTFVRSSDAPSTLTMVVALAPLFVAMAAVEARFACFDQLSKGFDYVSALHSAWKGRRLFVRPLLLSAAWLGVTSVVRYALSLALGVEATAGTAFRGLVGGDISVSTIGATSWAIVQAAAGFLVSLLVAHMLGQFAASTFPEVEAGSSEQANPADGPGGVG